jgi:hypothetical protein
MGRTPPVVLIASASLHERRMVESILKKTGFTTLLIDEAEDAVKELSTNGAAGVLVIDSGLLEAAHDAQWRELRMRYPALGAAVRCLLPRTKGIERRDGTTLLVDPDNDEGLRKAVSALAGDASPLDRSVLVGSV